MASRKEIRTVLDDFELSLAICQYKSANDDKNKATKLTKTLGDQIKENLKCRNLTDYVTDGIKVHLTIIPNEDFNELQAIEILRNQLNEEDFNSIVKTKEYIDEDALEKMLYTKKLDANILAPAYTPKEPTVRLTVGKAKAGE